MYRGIKERPARAAARFGRFSVSLRGNTTGAFAAPSVSIRRHTQKSKRRNLMEKPIITILY